MANAGAIDTVLVPGCRALAPDVFRNGGTYVRKTGYHNSRDNLKRSYPNNYSIQTVKDKRGPGSKGSAFDWVFEDARLRSDFDTIAKFSRRLYRAGQEKDPRAYPLREFFGNIDADRTVEGWSFYRNRAVSSDPSHLWHIHFSVWREYIDDEAAMRSILSILKGEDMPLSTEDLGKIRKIIREEVAEVWEADVIPNTFDNSTTNPTWRAKNALAEIGKNTEPKS